MLPDKVGAIIIQNDGILLVSDEETPFFWMPGGKIESPESHEECLRRELHEELGVAVTDFRFLFSQEFFHEKAQERQPVHYYLTSIVGTPVPRGEITRMHWYTRSDYADGFPITRVSREYVVPYLIEHALLR
jgi:ADP-ribose pyrophosphatase YjhB (NUDIX family)